MNEGLPSHEAFYIDLKKSNISEDEYNLVKQTGQENNWQTLRDLLIFYNMIDVGPFVEAIAKIRAPYLEKGLDIFKTTFFISGVARLLMMKKISKNTFFCLYPKRHADLYQRIAHLRSFHRFHKNGCFWGDQNLPSSSGEPRDLPANSRRRFKFFIFSFHQRKLSYRLFCVYFEENNFSPDPCSKYGLSSLQWLSYISS